jgi:adenylate kinase
LPADGFAVRSEISEKVDTRKGYDGGTSSEHLARMKDAVRPPRSKLSIARFIKGIKRHGIRPHMDLKIVLLGPPGSGKGTQTEKLCADLKLTKISTGDLLREAVRNNTPLGIKAKGFMDAGKLVPNDLVIDLVQEKLNLVKGGVILDGFPRSLEQAEMLDGFAKVDLALDIEVNEDNLVRRLTLRRTCKSCNAVYHLEFNPPKQEGKCDKCGGDLFQRSDDTERTVRERLKVYKDQTLPLTAYYEKKGILRTVDGEGDIKDVYERILKVIGSH